MTHGKTHDPGPCKSLKIEMTRTDGYGKDLDSEALSLWPEFPLIVQYYIAEDEDDLIAALEHPIVELGGVRYDRGDGGAISGADTSRAYGTQGRIKDMLYLPGDFLGGSAPCLQHLSLESAAFDDLPKLLLSTRDLVSLRLEDFPPPWGRISPEEIVGGLAGLTRLRTLSIRFTFPYERWGSPMDPQPCAVLPALTEFEFRGGSKYLVAHP
ncbi:hypothetical protein EDB85DRAFT_2256455 [Lactarius pseudohatsudake]|nr:hypothetical protein EDB85DRAFT_2256455 [Lactarius pseudohatsudake]